MNKPGYFAVFLVVFGLVMAGAAGQEGEAGAASSQEESAPQPTSQSTGAAPEETALPETPQEEPIPQSDIVIDMIAGERTIGANEVVKRAKLLFGELEIDGQVLEDVQMIAGEITVRGRVYDRVELVAGEVTVNGRVGPGGVDVKFGEVTVFGVVEGPVNVRVGEVSVRGDGVIQGNVRVEEGDFSRVEDSPRMNEWISQMVSDWTRGVVAFLGVMTLIGLAATILVLALLFRTSIQRGVTLMEKENLAWDLLWGFIATFMFLPIFVMLCVTIIGIPLALLLLFLYPAAWLYGLILLANYLGDWILISLFKGQSNFLVGTIFGIILLGISVAVPVFGPLLLSLYSLLAIGLSCRLMVEYIQERRRPQPPPEATAEAG